MCRGAAGRSVATAWPTNLRRWSMSELVPTRRRPQDDEAALLDYLVDSSNGAGESRPSRSTRTLTMTYWLVGQRDLGQHATQQSRRLRPAIVAAAGPTIDRPLRRGFRPSNLAGWCASHGSSPTTTQLAHLAQQLSWTHVESSWRLKSDASPGLLHRGGSHQDACSVRELTRRDRRKAYERREIANSQIPEGSAVPRDTFSDPLILDTLGLHDTYLEKDLEAAILRDSRPSCSRSATASPSSPARSA